MVNLFALTGLECTGGVSDNLVMMICLIEMCFITIGAALRNLSIFLGEHSLIRYLALLF